MTESIEERMARLADAARRLPNYGKQPPRSTTLKLAHAPKGIKAQQRANSRVNFMDRSLPRERDCITTRDFNQAQFQASGAAASQNAKLLAFFRQPQNSGLWFKGSFLEELSGASRMNNRAVDLREILKCEGLWIDNYMLRPTPGAGVVSCYRLCKIEDALNLSASEKAEIRKGISFTHS